MWGRLLVSGIVVVLVASASACQANRVPTIDPVPPPKPSVRAPDFGQFDKQRVETFLLEALVTADELATITKAALEQFQEIIEKGTDDALVKLRGEYRQDAERAYQLLMNAEPKPSLLGDIRRILDEKF